MSKPDLTLVLGLTEAEWLACANPVRLVKRLRAREGCRRYTLLSCAYALDVPHVGLTGLGREIVETVRRLTLSAPPTGLLWSDMSHQLIAALAGHSRDGLPLVAGCGLTPHALNRIGPGCRVTDEVVRAAFPQVFGWRATNRVSAMVEAHIRRETHRRVRAELNQLCRRPPACGPREAVLRMLPDEDRKELARVDWHGDDTLAPGRILRRVQAVTTKAHLTEARRVMADLVRDVTGNPFRKSAIEADWLAWNHGAVKHIAEQIDTSGNFADLPILADALEEAGCTDEELLGHCRADRPHVPGCWALDTVLGR
jgi:hypothetical protein